MGGMVMFGNAICPFPKYKYIIVIISASAILLIFTWFMMQNNKISEGNNINIDSEMIEIPPGEFMMGSPQNENGREPWDDEDQHKVFITYTFKITKYEITQRQWMIVMGTTIQQQRNKAISSFENRSVFVWIHKIIVLMSNKLEILGIGDEYPMCYVSWNEAMEFCNRWSEIEKSKGRLPYGLTYRLPTEAEWEYACRAGSTTRFANGDSIGNLNEIAWYVNNSKGSTHPVGEKLPNNWGLYDMHGNVCEWCYDWYDKYSINININPVGPENGNRRVGRGGGTMMEASRCRSAQRYGWYPSDTHNLQGFGFRVVLGPPLKDIKGLKANIPPGGDQIKEQQPNLTPGGG